MATGPAAKQRVFWTRPKYLIFAFVSLMIA